MNQEVKNIDAKTLGNVATIAMPEGGIKTLEEVEKTIDILLNELNKQITDTNTYVHISESTLLKIGSELAYVSSNMTDKEFKRLKSQTAKRLGNDESNIDKVIKISRNSGIRKYKEQLPTGWSALYLLCQIEPEDFDNFMVNSGVNTSTTRADLRKIIDEFKDAFPDKYPKKQTSVVKKNERLAIKQINSNSIDITSAAELEPLLKQFLLAHGWELVKSKKEPTPQNVAPVGSAVVEGEKQANNEQDFEHQNVA